LFLTHTFGHFPCGCATHLAAEDVGKVGHPPMPQSVGIVVRWSFKERSGTDLLLLRNPDKRFVRATHGPDCGEDSI